jgi:hypothetical protein
MMRKEFVGNFRRLGSATKRIGGGLNDFPGSSKDQIVGPSKRAEEVIGDHPQRGCIFSVCS